MNVFSYTRQTQFSIGTKFPEMIEQTMQVLIYFILPSNIQNTVDFQKYIPDSESSFE